MGEGGRFLTPERLPLKNLKISWNTNARTDVNTLIMNCTIVKYLNFLTRDS